MRPVHKKTTWKKEVSLEEDTFVTNPNAGDLVIPIMGPTGAGKSTFINALFGEDVAVIGHDLRSQTQRTQYFIYPYPDRRIIIVDTPGFDDTTRDDCEILRCIATWLARSYDSEMRLAGLVYIHEITQTRMLGTARKNFDMFRKLCGSEATENITLMTTKWSQVSETVGARREDQLRKDTWKELLCKGSQMRRFDYTRASAQGIIMNILARKAVNVVQIQSELVLIGKSIPETEAGRSLRYTLNELLEVQKKVGKKLQSSDDDETGEQAIENANKIRHLLKQIRLLNVPFSMKIRRFFGLR